MGKEDIAKKYRNMYWRNWYESHKEEWREYHREYTRVWRAKAEAERYEAMTEGQKKLYRLARGKV